MTDEKETFAILVITGSEQVDQAPYYYQPKVVVIRSLVLPSQLAFVITVRAGRLDDLADSLVG